LEIEYAVIVTVKSQKGKCSAGHKVGNKAVFKGLKLEGYICPSAFDVLYRYIYALKMGAEFPWAKGEVITVACPDAENPVVFELRRQKCK